MATLFKSSTEEYSNLELFEHDFDPEIPTIRELGNQYAAQLINSIRQQLGIDGTVVVNRDSVALAEALKSEDIDYNGFYGDYAKPLNGSDRPFVKETYEKMGLKTDGYRGGQHVTVIGSHYSKGAYVGNPLGLFLNSIFHHILWPILWHPEEDTFASEFLLNSERNLLGLSETPFNVEGSWDGIHLALLSESDVADSSKFDVTANLTVPVPSLTAAKKAQEQAQESSEVCSRRLQASSRANKSDSRRMLKAQTAQTATAESIALAKEP